MRFVLAAFAMLLPVVVCAQQAPDPDPLTFVRTIDSTLNPLCQKLNKSDSTACEDARDALETDVFYLDTPKARAYLHRLFGDDEFAWLLEKHGSTTYEQVSQKFLQLQGTYAK